MHVDPIFAATKHTRSAVAFKRLAALLAPFSDIRRSFAAAPKMALVAGIPSSLQFGVARSTANLALLRSDGLEAGAAHRANEGGLAGAVPTSRPVAVPRAEPVRVLSDPRCGSIELVSALFARKLAAVLRPIERLTGNTLVPWWIAVHGAIVSFLWANSPLNTAYTQMAMERCKQDAPLFADMAPVPEPPEDERMRDLFEEAAD